MLGKPLFTAMGLPMGYKVQVQVPSAQAQPTSCPFCEWSLSATMRTGLSKVKGQGSERMQATPGGGSWQTQARVEPEAQPWGSSEEELGWEAAVQPSWMRQGSCVLQMELDGQLGNPLLLLTPAPVNKDSD